MSLGNRLSGLLLISLGAIGFAICLAGIAGVSIVASRLQQVNSRVFRQVDQLVLQVDQRVAQAQDAVGGTRDLVEALKKTLQESATELLAERVSSLPEVDNLERRLASAMERADGLVEVSASTTELIAQLLETIGAIASERSVDLKGSSDLKARILATQKSLANASERLDDVQRRLAEVRQKRDVAVNLSEITKLSLGIIAALDVGQEQISTFRIRLDEIQSRGAQSQDRMRNWIRAGQCLILLLLAWIGAGQYCLLLQGWRILRPPLSRAA